MAEDSEKAAADAKVAADAKAVADAKAEAAAKAAAGPKAAAGATGASGDGVTSTASQPPPIAVPKKSDSINFAEVNVSSTRELARAGVDLSKFLLTLVGMSTALLVIYLWSADYHNANTQQEVYQKVLQHVIVEVPVLPALQQIDAWNKDLTDLLANTSAAATAEAQARGTSLVALIRRSGVLPKEQNAALGGCVNPPAATRQTDLPRCIEILDLVAKQTVAAQAMVDNNKLLVDFAKQVDAQRDSFRAFWLQTLQIVLVNVLLPLLTALFGYIFGTQARSEG